MENYALIRSNVDNPEGSEICSWEDIMGELSLQELHEALLPFETASTASAGAVRLDQTRRFEKGDKSNTVYTLLKKGF